jgi:hypothetical protein
MAMRNLTAAMGRTAGFSQSQDLPPARGFLPSLVAVAGVLASVTVVHGGPCTEQIAQVERQVADTAPGPESGPTGQQTIGAQLHRQPTPGSVNRAEHVANKDADEALNRAKAADAAGNAADCNAALQKARELYGID